MSVEVTHERDADGTFFEAKCACGKKISSYVQRGMPSYVGQGDMDCTCGRTFNSFGQEIEFPQGQGEDYAGERYDEE